MNEIFKINYTNFLYKNQSDIMISIKIDLSTRTALSFVSVLGHLELWINYFILFHVLD